MNETQLWYCDICDKTIDIESKSKHIILNLIDAKNKMVMLLKNMNLLDQKLIKRIIYSLILIKIVKINFFFQLKLDAYMTLKVQIWKIMKKIFHQLHSDI